MTKTFAETETEHQRRVILELLEQDPDYSHNEMVIKSALRSLGHSVSSDKLHTELAWLSEQGLLKLEVVTEITVARLTARGQDVAQGSSQVPGIARKGI